MKWEYLSLVIETGGFLGGKMDAQKFTDTLNSRGAEGWELVSVFDTNMQHGVTRHVIAILKRRISE